MVAAQLKELLLQSLVHERGGVLVYQTALECARNRDLRNEWSRYLEQTLNHVAALQRVCELSGLDPGEMTPGCNIVRHNGKALVVAMEMALAEGDPAAAELVAAECVVLAETKDHADWQLLSRCAESLDGEAAPALREACDRFEDEEHEHLNHSQGWSRELWLKSLGIKATLPPQEEKQDLKGAAEAESARKRR